jgi:hypothetical protein
MPKSKKSKKVNPNRIQATKADLQKAEKEAKQQAITISMAIIFTALLDCGYADTDRLKEIWNRVCYVSDSVNKGYATVTDLVHTLKVEYGIQV